MTTMRTVAAPLIAALLAVVVAGCSGGGPRVSGSPAVQLESGALAASLAAGFPIGSWTTTITEADLRAGGITTPGELAENSGVFTTTFAPDGTWTTAQQAPGNVRSPVFRGTWTAVGPDTIRQTTTFPGDFAGDIVDLTWRVAPDGLQLAVPNPPDHILNVVTSAHPWQRAP
jgi:hypothetical protein